MCIYLHIFGGKLHLHASFGALFPKLMANASNLFMLNTETKQNYSCLHKGIYTGV